MCSCAFYPLHLVYSGLIWIFGVRVNYISYKLFLHFLHLTCVRSSCSFFRKNTVARGRVSPLEIKNSNENLPCVHRSRNRQFLSISHRLSFIEHRHTSRHTFQHVHAAHVHGYSVIPSSHLGVIKKEMSLSQAVVHCEFI